MEEQVVGRRGGVPWRMRRCWAPEGALEDMVLRLLQLRMRLIMYRQVTEVESMPRKASVRKLAASSAAWMSSG